MARRACLTHEALPEEGLYIASRCSSCKEAFETNNHLFLHCRVTAQVWALFINLANVNWSMPEHPAYILRIVLGGRQLEPEDLVEYCACMHLVEHMEETN